jgi:CheY-like chemotaxis protein
MDLTPLVLVIDDTPQNARLLEAMLSPRDSGPPTRRPSDFASRTPP